MNNDSNDFHEGELPARAARADSPGQDPNMPGVREVAEEGLSEDERQLLDLTDGVSSDPATDGGLILQR